MKKEKQYLCVNVFEHSGRWKHENLKNLNQVQDQVLVMTSSADSVYTHDETDLHLNIVHF